MSEGEFSTLVKMEAGEASSSRGNVSVTPINMSTSQTNNGQFSYSSSSVRISVPPRDLRSADEDDSTDAEVSNIDFTPHHYQQVNMRSKQRPSSSLARCELAPERPMSWEGELSDSDMPVDATSGPAKSRVESVSGSGGGSCSGSGSADATIASASAAPFRDDQRVPPPAHLHLQHRSLSMNRIAVVSEGIRNVPVGIAPQLSARRDPPAPPQTILPEVKCEVGSPVRAPRGLSTASTDSAIHSMYTHSVYSSPSASPSASRHFTPSLSRNNSDASHSSCYSYSSEFSPTHSPVQSRHMVLGGAGGAWRDVRREGDDDEGEGDGGDKLTAHGGGGGVSRQQLINSPCPICGDKISGFHYGIFSCESCKGFFKRTVQNRKNYVCLRGANCPVGVATRKKCPACRFDKCLHCGMKLEAIREDRTRGGRSTYQCAYSLASASASNCAPPHALRHASSLNSVSTTSAGSSCETPRVPDRLVIPQLLQEIMDVEHLWQYSESELSRMQRGPPSDLLNDLCNIADHRLYKIVKWCKSLPLFKNISIDDQICLLINSWCELLVLSCCYRGVATPGEVRVGNGRTITLHQSTKLGLTPCIERMLAFTDHLRRLRVDRYEYVALKVIVLLTSDASELREPEKVRASQERALAALQAYTGAHYPNAPAKFGELLLRIPDLQRTCQVGKEMLNPSNKTKDGESFNLLMELLRGDH